ncbi:hypothetical protein Tco_0138195 [Tanacetum coccineum]
MVKAGHAAYIERFHELARLDPYLVTPKSRKIKRYVYVLALQIRGMVAATKLKTMQKTVQISGALINEAVRNVSIKKVEKIGNEERIRVLGLSVPLATPTMHSQGLVAHALTVTAWVILQGIVELFLGIFVSTSFVPLLGIEPSELGFRYEIKIASGHRSFDVIIGMDWLSNHKAEIICHEKLVRIPLLNGKVLRVLGERLEEKARFLMSAKVSDKKQREIVVVRDFPKGLLLDDILIYSKTREEHVEHLRLVLKLLNKEKLYAKFSKREFWLREVQFLGHVINGNGIHVDPSKIEAVKNLKAPKTTSEKELNMRQRRWIELFSDYDCEIRYHPGKANVVADALRRKERVKPKRVRYFERHAFWSLNEDILKITILTTNTPFIMERGSDEMIEQRRDGTLYYLDQIRMPLKGDVRTLLMNKSCKSKYSVYPRADKMYYDLRDRLRLSIKGHLACSSNLRFPYGNGKE